MAADTFTEVTRHSWGGRMGSAFKGILFGIVLFAGAFVLLFWNEGRSVTTYKALKEGAGAVVSVDANEVDPANEGALVHLSGLADTRQALADPIFGGEVKAIHLAREVLMYQWQESSHTEEKKDLGGSTETVTTYTYDKDWSPTLISSKGFKKPEGHQNPTAMPYRGETFSARTVTLGAFTLSPALVSDITGGEPHTVTTPVASLPGDLKFKTKAHEGGYYVGGSPQNPQVGDLRVSFSVVMPQTVSIVAMQKGSSFAPYRTTVGKDILRLQAGEHTAAAMFEAAQSENTVLTWILRVVGFLAMFIGLRMMLAPISVAMDVLPFLGNIAEMGLGMVSFLITLVLSLITIAVAWIVYRPLLAGVLIAVAVAGVFAFIRLRRKKGMPPPPPLGSPA